MEQIYRPVDAETGKVIVKKEARFRFEHLPQIRRIRSVLRAQNLYRDTFSHIGTHILYGVLNLGIQFFK
jgi:hypothetical protein